MAIPDHVSTETLADHAEGLLREADAASVTAHLGECAECRAESLLLASLRDLLAADDPGPMPAAYAARIDLALGEAATAYPAGSGAPPPPLDLAPAATTTGAGGAGGAEIIDLAERRKVVAQGLSRVTTVAASIVLLIGGTVLGMQALNSNTPDAPNVPFAIGSQDPEDTGEPGEQATVQPSPFRPIKNPAVEIDPKGKANPDGSWTNRTGTVILPGGAAVPPDGPVIPAPKGKAATPAKDPADVAGPVIDSSKGGDRVRAATKGSAARPEATGAPPETTTEAESTPGPEPEPTSAPGTPRPEVTPASASEPGKAGPKDARSAARSGAADKPAYVEDSRSPYTVRNFAQKVRTLVDKAGYRESSLGEPVPDAEEGPADPDPATVDPATVDPATVDPATVDPATVDPATVDPAAMEPAAMEPAAMEPVPVSDPSASEFREASLETPQVVVDAAATGPADQRVKDRVQRCATQLGGRAIAGDTGTWRGKPVTIVVVPDPADERQVIARAVSGPCSEERPATDPANVRHTQFVYLRP